MDPLADRKYLSPSVLALYTETEMLHPHHKAACRVGNSRAFGHSHRHHLAAEARTPDESQHTERYLTSIFPGAPSSPASRNRYAADVGHDGAIGFIQMHCEKTPESNTANLPGPSRELVRPIERSVFMPASAGGAAATRSHRPQQGGTAKFIGQSPALLPSRCGG
jgi:hypothetical protein